MSSRSTPLGASSTPWSSSRDRSSRVRRPAPVCTAGSTWSLAPMRKRHRIWWRSFRVIWESWTWSKDTGMVPTSYWVSTSFSSRVNSSPSSAVSPRGVGELVHDGAQQLPELAVLLGLLELPQGLQLRRPLLQPAGQVDLREKGPEGLQLPGGALPLLQPPGQAAQGAAHPRPDGVDLPEGLRLLRGEALLPPGGGWRSSPPPGPTWPRGRPRR